MPSKRSPIDDAERLLIWMRAKGILHAEVGGISLTRDPSFEDKQEAAGLPDPEPNPFGNDIVPPEKGVYHDPYLWSEDGDVEIPKLKDIRIALVRDGVTEASDE